MKGLDEDVGNGFEWTVCLQGTKDGMGWGETTGRQDSGTGTSDLR